MDVVLGFMIRSDTVQITPEILSLIAEIDEFKGAWRALGTLAPDRLSALRRVATIESIGSSTRIEGSRLSDREVERLLSRLQIKSFTTRDEQEVAGYAEVMERVFASWPDITLTENHIKQLHRDLLTHSEKDAWHRGNYKTSYQQRGGVRRRWQATRRRIRDGDALRHTAPDERTGNLVQ
jgi:Fic family protein